MKLRETLMAYMLPLLVLPVVAFGYLAYQFSKQYLQQQAYYQAEQVLSQQQLQLSGYLLQQQTQLSTLVHSPALWDYTHNADALALTELKQQLGRVMQATPALVSVKLVHLTGEYALQLPERPQKSALPNRFRNEYFSSLQAQVDDSGYFLAEDNDTAQLQLFFAHKLYTNSVTESRRLWGYLVLGETLTGGFVAGGAIVCLAVWLVVSPSRAAKPAKAQPQS